MRVYDKDLVQLDIQTNLSLNWEQCAHSKSKILRDSDTSWCGGRLVVMPDNINSYNARFMHTSLILGME